MLYQALSNSEGQIVDNIFKILVDKQEITRESLLKIFKELRFNRFNTNIIHETPPHNQQLNLKIL